MAAVSATTSYDEFVDLVVRRRALEDAMELPAVGDAALNGMGIAYAEIDRRMSDAPARSIEGVIARLSVVAEEFDRYYVPDPEAADPAAEMLAALLGRSVAFLQTVA